MNLFSGLMSMMRGGDFKEETPNKHKNNNNLQQPAYSDTSSVQNDLSGRQREMIDLSENKDVDPHTLGNPHLIHLQICLALQLKIQTEHGLIEAI